MQVAVVPLAVLVGQVQGVGGEGLGAAALLQQEGRVVAGHSPRDVGRHCDRRQAREGLKWSEFVA